MKLRLITCLLLIVFSFPAYALQTFLDEWRDYYPNSNSDDSACQLCHVNPTGNSPWNAYGITVRNVLEGLNALGGGATQAQLQQAFSLIEEENLDSDPSGATSLTEIDNSYQPGWTDGANNTITFVDNLGNKSTLDNQLPPVINSSATLIDPAIPINNSLPPVSTGNLTVNFETIADGFVAPVMATPAQGLPEYLFVVEQTGEIWQVLLSDGSRDLFLDVGPDGLNLLISGSGERGLLGLAFHPDYIDNGLFYTYQSEPTGSQQPEADFSTMPLGQFGNHQTVISEWTVTNPAANAIVSPVRRVLLRIEQPQGNHNGGMLAFGPDRALYVSLGDGGAADDQAQGHGENGNSRDNTNPLGSILRINPQGNNSNNGEYGILADNPFVGQSGLDEVYAYGFRNPFRFSFDRRCFEANQNCNTLLLGDVGQGEVEEINNVVAGGNYGWNWKEGSFFFYPPTPSIYGGGRYISDQAPPSLPNDLIDPLVEYSSSDGRSAIGGFVYRGSNTPEFDGRYVFADFFNRLFYIDSANRIREFRNSQNINFNIAGFAEDLDNELYILTRSGSTGALRRLTLGQVEIEIDNTMCFPINATNGNISVICL